MSRQVGVGWGGGGYLAKSGIKALGHSPHHPLKEENHETRMDRGAPVRWGSTAYADAFTWRVATVPSLKPFFALRSTFFRNLMRPAPVVRRRMAWTDQWYLCGSRWQRCALHCGIIPPLAGVREAARRAPQQTRVERPLAAPAAQPVVRVLVRVGVLKHQKAYVWEWCPLSPFDVVPFVMLWLSQWLLKGVGVHGTCVNAGKRTRAEHGRGGGTKVFPANALM